MCYVIHFSTLFSMKAWCKVWYCCLQSISQRTVHWGELLVVPTTELLTFNFNFLQWRNCVDCGAVMIILYFLPLMKTTKTTHNHQSSSDTNAPALWPLTNTLKNIFNSIFYQSHMFKRDSTYYIFYILDNIIYNNK